MISSNLEFQIVVDLNVIARVKNLLTGSIILVMQFVFLYFPNSKLRQVQYSIKNMELEISPYSVMTTSKIMSTHPSIHPSVYVSTITVKHSMIDFKYETLSF